MLIAATLPPLAIRITEYGQLVASATHHFNEKGGYALMRRFDVSCALVKTS